MKRMAVLGLIAGIVLANDPAVAQWLNYPTAGIPRLPDGTPNLTASTPRRSEGTPDLSGIWEPTPKYIRNIAADLRPEDVPFQPWAEALYKERLSGARSREESDANCLPQGVPKIDATPYPYKFIHTPTGIIILYEVFTQWRQIFTDGRPAPKDPNPTWLGYSVGRWAGNTLVVDTTGFNGKTWLDQVGHPSTEALHVTERFTRLNVGQMEIRITIDDPRAYTKPWTVVENLKLLVDSELLEFVCHENNKDLEHLPGAITK
jgi:hypothetical protein